MLLTVAIPTYNRYLFLVETIDALLPQIIEINRSSTGDFVELLICNNASTDETEEYLLSLEIEHDFIRVHHETENVGIDGNIHNCATYSKGEYVFSLSDDDIPENGIISKVLQHLLDGKKKGSDNIFVFLNGFVFSGEYNSSFSKQDRIFLEDKKDVIFNDRQKFLEYIGVWATFVSSFVYKRSAWLKAAEGQRFIGTDIYLSYVLYSMLRDCEEMILVSKPLIAIRAQYSGNYRILKAFCVEWSNLLNNISVVEWGYSAEGNRKVFLSSFYSNLINKVLDVKRSNSTISDSDTLAIMSALDNFPLEKLLMRFFLYSDYRVVLFVKKLITFLGVKTDNFLRGN